MAHAFIGVGQCGCQILDEIFSVKNMFRYATNVLAIDSTQRTLFNLKNIPVENRAGITTSGEIKPARTQEFAKFVSDGRGGEAKMLSDVLEDRFTTFSESFINAFIPEGGTIPSTVVFVCSLGSGTGGGCTPYFAKAVKKKLKSNVIVVGILPANKEGTKRARSAIFSINKMRNFAEGFILIDNEKIAHYSNLQSKYKEYNQYIASAIRELMVGHQIRNVDTKGFDRKQVDAMDIITASSSRGGKTVFSAISYVGDLCSTPMCYLIPKFLSFGYKKFEYNDITNLADKCVKHLTLDKVNEERAIEHLVILAYPKHYQSRSDKIVDSALYDKFGGKNLQIGHSLTIGRELTLTLLSTFETDNIERLVELERIAFTVE